MAEQTRSIVKRVEQLNAVYMNEKQHGLPEINADQLFGSSSTVAILHAGEVYLLTRTKLNKLLLTKQGIASAIPVAVRSAAYKE